jgi:hypothetical protein
MTGGDTDSDRPAGTLNKAGWRAVTIGSIVISVGLLAALLAQDGLFSDSSDHPDGLTTLALVLAVLAFLVQIFVFVFQTWAGSGAVQRSEELNAGTRQVLSKIEANSAATQRVLFAQFDRLLDYVVDGSVDGPVDGETGDRVDEPDFVTADDSPVTVGQMTRLLNDLPRSRERPSFEAPLSSGSAEDRNVLSYLREWPTKDEAQEAVAELTRFPPLALTALTRLGTVEIRERRDGLRVGLALAERREPPVAMRYLIDRGLVRRSGEVIALTDGGRALARVLPIGKPANTMPDWYDEVLAPLMKTPGATR